MTAELPPRPEPPRRWSDTVQAWLAWFGPARLIVSALSVAVVAVGVAWLVRTPALPTEAGLPFTTATANSAAGNPAATQPSVPTPGATLPLPEQPVNTAGSVGPVLVHVAGAVVRPGVYELAIPARVHVAIEAAGGPIASADLDGLNLAAAVADGQRVYVPEAGEVDPASVPAGPMPPETAGAGDSGGGSADPIDLNTASAIELESLPGVGPATAAAIIDDRDRHGPFAAVADLQRVPGIGPAKLARIVDLVTV